MPPSRRASAGGGRGARPNVLRAQVGRGHAVIVGIGIDVVDLARFERAASRTPALIPRLFAPSEQDADGRRMPLRSLAGRFAAKEALIKAIGHSDGMRWHDLTVSADPQGKPSFLLHGNARRTADELGISRLHLSMTHDAGIAMAFVVAERDG